ncbi:branched-chain amino acid ABC transporter permease [Paenibacillus sp.]|jgi:branched-chain amino acid transport system permease protein|uniref:branched-chain amino acid ABC transporter permease n=1 Tax=Paenibacillus sp. TaxID=58172 RepID=UPI0028214921|nr:branched-chain amino acid ABC transporter permease [Paenibacillus sp.]MDR0270559.1 branched-chain amino acid ABC transporter permease [Paenibacillus sp.]
MSGNTEMKESVPTAVPSKRLRNGLGLVAPSYATSSRWFIGISFVIIAALFAVPFLSDSRSLFILLTQIFILGIFAMSYDLLLGFTGIVSFGHAMFFGLGGYATGIFMNRFGATLPMLLLSVLVGMVLAALLSYIVGMLSLRLKNHFYAMLTLAFAGLLLVAAEKWRSLTKGSDGFTFSIPEPLKNRVTLYLISLAAMVLIFFLLRRFTGSPFGRVLQAIRENEQRAESLGYRVVHYKVIATVMAGIVASVSGSLYVLTLRFVNTTVFSMDMTLNALLMTIIGGVGTLFGALIGAAVIEWAHHFLTGLASIHPIFERWIIFFGLLYIVVVLVFPSGIAGTGQKWLLSWRLRRLKADNGEETS